MECVTFFGYKLVFTEIVQHCPVDL